MRIAVICQILAKQEEPKRIYECVIIVRLFTRVKTPKNHRNSVLEKLNDYHSRSWAGCFRIHEDTEIEGNWAINVLEHGASVDQVWDVIL